jgi:hypothetical protein
VKGVNAMDDQRCVECASSKLYARSRCQTCYGRHRRELKRAGEFAPLLIIGAPLDRLMMRTEPGPNDCLLYIGTLNNGGYGQIMVDGSQMLAHRAAYRLQVGPIPDGMVLDHTCHNRDASCLGGRACLHRRCVNVAHLEPVSGAENTRRGRTWAINGTKTHCPSGHPYDEANTHVCGGRRYCRACNRALKAAS